MRNVNKNIWVGVTVVGFVLMLLGGCYQADQWRKAELAEAKVVELAAACETAKTDYRSNWKLATEQWEKDQQAFLDARQFLLGDLKATLAVPQGVFDICGSNLVGLQGRLTDSRYKVQVYDTAVALIDELNQIVVSATAELQLARDAKGALEDVEVYAWYTVKPHVYDPPWDAVDSDRAVTEFNFGMSQITQGWYEMANSEWSQARVYADYARADLAAAYGYASSPTPTPEPTDTPEPTNTPEPYVPPPTSSYDWSSDDSSGSDSGSWDSGGSDSGSWDSGSDSGSWDSGSDSGSWDSGGSDSGSWDSGGSDSGSWKVAPRMTATPQRVIK